MAIQDHLPIQMDKTSIADTSHLQQSVSSLLSDNKAYQLAKAAGLGSALDALKNAGLADIQICNGMGTGDNGASESKQTNTATIEQSSNSASIEQSARAKTGVEDTAKFIPMQNAVGSSESARHQSEGGKGRTEHWGSIEVTANPDGSAVAHVHKGDTVWKIAKETLKHDSRQAPTVRETANEVVDIVRANGKLKHNPDHIEVGQDISIPKRSQSHEHHQQQHSEHSPAADRKSGSHNSSHSDLPSEPKTAEKHPTNSDHPQEVHKENQPTVVHGDKGQTLYKDDQGHLTGVDYPNGNSVRATNFDSSGHAGRIEIHDNGTGKTMVLTRSQDGGYDVQGDPDKHVTKIDVNQSTGAATIEATQNVPVLGKQAVTVTVAADGTVSKSMG